MNLRVIPAVASAPTVIFSLNWHSLPSALPFPHFYSSQLVACQENSIHPPRNSLALDKSVGFMVLIDSVTFDLSKDLVTVACNDGQSYQWSISQVGGFKDALEAVLKCVKDSGVEAEKEKKAAAAAAQAAANPKTVAPKASEESIPASTASTSSSSSSTKRHRTASGIFSSLVASFITPTPASSQSDTTSPAHLAHLYAYRQRRKSSQTLHKQHMDHPSNARQTFNNSPVPQSRFLRRQARARLVDIFRFYVASVLNEKMREHGIVGEELKSRGILDDLDEEHAVGASDALSGVGGYSSAGGYVGYMARSQLRNAFAELAKEQAATTTSSDDHSSSDESILLTPKSESDNSLSLESSATSPRGRRPSSRTSSATSVHSQKIRQLSSVLIGMTQREKRNTEDERETMEEIKDRSLRRRWSLHEKSRLTGRGNAAVRNTFANLAGSAIPMVSSPLREVVVVRDEAREESQAVVEVKVVKEKASDDEIIIVMDKRHNEAESVVVKSSAEKVEIPSIVIEEIHDEITFPSAAVEVSQVESIPFPSVAPAPSRRSKSLPPSSAPPVLSTDEDETEELQLPELISESKESKQRDANDRQSVLSSPSLHRSSSKSNTNGGSSKAPVKSKSAPEEDVLVGNDRSSSADGIETRRARRVALPSTPSPTSPTSSQSSVGSPTSPTSTTSEQSTTATPPLSPSSTFSSPVQRSQSMSSDGAEKTPVRSSSPGPAPTSPSSCPATPDSFRSKSCPLPEPTTDNDNSWFRGSATYVVAPKPKSKYFATYEVAPPAAASQDSFISNCGAAGGIGLGLGLEFDSQDGVIGSSMVGSGEVFWTHFSSDNGKRPIGVIRSRGCEGQSVLVA